MKNKIERIKSSGESLSETLVAALIISLAMIMLFSGVKVATDIMSKTRAGYQDYYDEINAYEETQASYAVEYYNCTEETDPRPDPYTFDMEPHKYNW